MRTIIEEYDDYGEIKDTKISRLSYDQKHRIHETKDMFDSDCKLCQIAIQKKVKTYWDSGDELDDTAILSSCPNR